MKKQLFKVFFFLVFSFALTHTVKAQEIHVLKYRNLNEDDPYKKVFNILSLNNEKNINNITLTYRTKVNPINKNKTVELNVSKPQMIDKVFFRDFEIDSLLAPDQIKITLRYFSSSQDTLIKNIRLYKLPAVVEVNLKNEKFTLHDWQIQYYFSNNKLKRFEKFTRKANLYYGYLSILKNLKKQLLLNDETGIGVLNDFDVYHRLLYNLNRENLISELHLNSSKHKQFLSLWKKAQRQERRKYTLSKQFIKRDLSTEKDQKIYINNLIAISTKALTIKDNLQPYLGNAYEQMSLIINDQRSKDIYLKVCTQANLNLPKNNPLEETVFEAFIEQSANYNKKEAYTYGLIMLQNAMIWTEITGLEKKKEITPFLIQTIDGMLSAYVSIAEAASLQNNLKMTWQYLQKAKSFHNKTLKEFPFLSDSSFVEFQNRLLNIAETELKKNHPHNALDLLFYFNQLKYAAINEQRLRKTLNQSYNDIYKNYFRLTSLAFNNGDTDEAFIRLFDLYHFAETHQNELTVTEKYQEKIQKIAYGLTLDYMQQGEILWDQNRSNEAINYFSKAKKLEDHLLHEKIPRLEKLLSQTAVPVVMEMMKEVELKIWANEPGEAKKLYDEVVNQIETYHLNQIDQVVQRLTTLKEKLDNRACLTVSQTLENNLDIIDHRIKKQKWNEALVKYRQTINLLQNNPHCKIDTAKFHSLQEKYGNAFYYLEQYELVKAKLFSKGINHVWTDLVDLEIFYNKHDLMHLGIDNPGLFNLLQNQKNVNITRKVIDYYLKKGLLLQAITYLDLLRKMGIHDKETKELLIKAGKLWAIQNSETPSFLSTLNEYEKWYKPLIKAYQATLN